MSIRQLSLTNFRNLQSVTLDFHPAINLIYGDNGSGKTSLLEAIYINCQTGSFRQHYLKKCISHNEKQFLIFGRYIDHKTGISKTDQKLEIRVDGESIKRRSGLVKLTPVKVFNADTFELVNGTPDGRRQFLDWCLFHVEHSYNENWNQFRHALKQRNRLLKDRRNLHLLDYWDEAISRPSAVLSDLRRDYCQKISDCIKELFGHLFADIDISLKYQAGWDTESSLLSSLKNTRDRDIRSGFTSQGIHRDNILIQSDGKLASDVLSRGQIKRLTMVMLLASLKIVSNKRKYPVVLLIDDLKAEIDRETEKLIYGTLLKMNLQVFVTNIDEEVPDSLKGKDFKMFHVEHGIIKPHKVS